MYFVSNLDIEIQLILHFLLRRRFTRNKKKEEEGFTK
jgi:hypothetical protein